MTTIVYRNGIMAADGRAYGGDKVPIGTKCKITRLEDGTLVAVSSTIVGAMGLIVDWYKNGAKEKGDDILPDKFTMLAVKPNGEGFMANNIAALTGPLRADYWAIGSGEEYALGALAYSEGCNAIAAVKAACELDVWSDLPIYFATHDNEIPKILLDISPDLLIQVV